MKIIYSIISLLFVAGCIFVTPKVSVLKFNFTPDGCHGDCEVYCCKLYESWYSHLGIKGLVSHCELLGSCSDNETDVKNNMCKDNYKMKDGIYELRLNDGWGLNDYSLEQGWRSSQGWNVITTRKLKCK